MKRKKKSRVGLTILDLILVVLIVAAVLSTVFSNQIRTFLQKEETVRIQYKFLIQDPREDAHNYPEIGDTMIELNSEISLGTVTDYKPDTVRKNATCTAEVEAVKEDGVYKVSGQVIKAGDPFAVKTSSSASFEMNVLGIEEIEED